MTVLFALACGYAAGFLSAVFHRKLTATKDKVVNAVKEELKSL